MYETSRTESDPTATLRRPATPRPNPRPLTAQQLDRVLDGASGDLRAMMLLAWLAGLRAHEVAKMRGEDINAREIRVTGKGGQTAFLPTHPDLWELAQEYPREGLWFPSPVNVGEPLHPVNVSARVRRRFRAVGIESGSMHRLRATYGTSLLRGGANLRVVQTLMRHQSLATTEHYLGVDEDERMAAVRMLAA